MMARHFLIRCGALVALSAAATIHVTQPALAQTSVKFSLDWKYEGTQAPFLVALDKGYFKAEGLDVTIDTGASALESINRFAAETYDMLVAGNVDAVTGLSFSIYINVKYSSLPRDDIVVMLMADFGVRLYGNGVMVSPKFAAERPDAVKGFLRAYLKGLKDTVKDPAAAIDSVLKRNEVATKPLEVQRLQMALRDNILTREVQAKGFGTVAFAGLDKAIEQIALTDPFKSST